MASALDLRSFVRVIRERSDSVATQRDMLRKEQCLLRSILTRFENLTLVESWVEPFSTSNRHAISDGTLRLVIEVTHRNPSEFWMRVANDALRFFSQDNSGLPDVCC